jgi:hypothetical protein
VLLVALVVLACLGVLGALGGAGHFLFYRPMVVIPREREQRKLYERWWSLEVEVDSFEPGEVPRQLYLQREDIIEECQSRFGQHPSAFRDLPPLSSSYYR